MCMSNEHENTMMSVREWIRAVSIVAMAGAAVAGVILAQDLRVPSAPQWIGAVRDSATGDIDVRWSEPTIGDPGYYRVMRRRAEIDPPGQFTEIARVAADEDRQFIDKGCEATSDVVGCVYRVISGSSLGREGNRSRYVDCRKVWVKEEDGNGRPTWKCPYRCSDNVPAPPASLADWAAGGTSTNAENSVQCRGALKASKGDAL